MNHIEIIVAEQPDTHGINSVINKHYAAPPLYYTPSELEEYDIVQSDSNIVFIAKQHTQIIGFIRLHGRHSFSIADSVATFEIVIDPAHRKSGIASNLLRTGIRYITDQTNVKILEAMIPTGNAGSKILCDRFGFILQSEELKGFVMTLELNR